MGAGCRINAGAVVEDEPDEGSAFEASPNPSLSARAVQLSSNLTPHSVMDTRTCVAPGAIIPAGSLIYPYPASQCGFGNGVLGTVVSLPGTLDWQLSSPPPGLVGKIVKLSNGVYVICCDQGCRLAGIQEACSPSVLVTTLR